MGYMMEYIAKMKNGFSMQDAENELLNYIKNLNKACDCYTLVFAAAINKQVPDAALSMEDYYFIHDILRKKNGKKIVVYLETPGGSGEAAEEIARLLHSKFDAVHFLISGEAKSAGTILALSGDEILMTDSGSLGPIDAQVKIGRSVTSAHDYLEWVDEKRAEAQKNGFLNPFDATMIAQISPGELKHVRYALDFAVDRVKEWLPKYKFKDWDKTETHGRQVTPEMKASRAEDIARNLTDHSHWKSHGRSLKIDDLDTLRLKIVKVDNQPGLADIVYRIQVLIRLLFGSTTAYKVFATEEEKIFRHAAPAQTVQKLPEAAVNEADVVELKVQCPACSREHKIYAKFIQNPQIDKDFQTKGAKPFPKDNKLRCECGFELDLSGLRNKIESDIKKKIL